MNDFTHISESIKDKCHGINDNNEGRNTVRYDINGNPSKKMHIYALDESKFTPNTEESQLAREIAIECNDLDNYACWYSNVNGHGIAKMMAALATLKNDVVEKANTKYPVRNKAKYLMWLIKTGKC